MNNKDLSYESVKAELESSVYAACKILEELEHKGLLRGNGHHARQTVAQFAVQELKSRYKNGL